MLAFALYTEDAEFEWESLGWSVLFCFPLALSVLSGGLGTVEFEYPSATFIVVGVWVAAMAPSFIIDDARAHQNFSYTDQAVLIGRWLFFLWCIVFVTASGRAKQYRLRLVPRVVDVVAVSTPAILAIAFLIVNGYFSSYRPSDSGAGFKAGGISSVTNAIGASALLGLPPFFEFVALRASTRRTRLVGATGFTVSWLLLFLTGSRSSLAYSTAICFFMARMVGVRFRMSIAVGAVAALPVLFFLTFVYRSSLRDIQKPTGSLSDYTDVAIGSTEDVINRADSRTQAVASFSSNSRTRFAYGPQFFAVVDEWLDHGPAFAGTILDGLIRALPSWFFPNKNALASEHEFERHLVATGRFPDTDLSPTPWMQCLYELGILGIFLGAIMYGLLMRTIDARAAASTSIYEILFWTGILCVALTPEQPIDYLFVGARSVAVVVSCSYAIVFVLRRAFPYKHELVHQEPVRRQPLP